MNKILLSALTLAFVHTANASEDSHWGYSGETGAKNWAQLSPDNYACNGNNQSPINLTGFTNAELPAIKFDYKVGGKAVVNNGHTIQVNMKKGNKIQIDNQSFDLLQFHFHAPSENHINGKSFPLEAHFVHANSEGNLAVVAVMYEPGKSNSSLEKAWSKMPKSAGAKNQLDGTSSVVGLLPSNRDYYRFSGSLTTPPCSEGVRWLVMKDTMTASESQIKTFTDVLSEPNNRPLQPLNARLILD